MEFDNTLKQREISSVEVSSQKDMESFCGEVGKILADNSKGVGDASHGEIWADYSTAAFTRHMICRVNEAGVSPEGNHIYNVSFSSCRGLSRIGDVLIALFILAPAWAVSRSFRTSSPGIYIAVAIVCALAAIILAALSMKKFGDKEAAVLSGEIKKAV